MSKTKSKYERHSNPTALIPRADLSASKGAGRIAQVILDVDLRNSHDGLMEIAKQKGLSLKDLKPGQYLVFVNLNRDRFKIFFTFFTLHCQINKISSLSKEVLWT